MSRSAPHCDADGYTYFSEGSTENAESGNATSLPVLYSVATSGEVKIVPRKAPHEYNNLTVLDFFPGDERLVTLLEASNRDDSENGAVKDTEYFLSSSDRDGDHPSLVRLDVKFRPLRVAEFASGDFLVLGWDKFGLLPALVLVQEDGGVRRFLDLDAGKIADARDAHAYDSVQDESMSPRARATLKSLEKSAFVPFGKQVMLTFPGTAKGIHVISEVGDERTIPIEIPAGYVLHDVVNGGARYWTIVVRVRPADSSKSDEAKGAEAPHQRLLELNATHGDLVTEFMFGTPENPGPADVMSVTCAANVGLTAIFLAPMNDSQTAKTVPGANANGDPPPPPPQHLVIGTMRR
ncbi:MAG TPA: hypothetical protein VGN16_13055 [Acidobacteriaceae bacterium]